MAFGERLAELRRANGLTQEAFAEQLNVSRQAVSKWESCRGYPEIDKILWIILLIIFVILFIGSLLGIGGDVVDIVKAICYAIVYLFMIIFMFDEDVRKKMGI